MRRIDIEIETERLRIEFPYDRSLVQTVKTLPQRRWDPDAKAWFVPFEHVDRVFETLLDRHFKISNELRSYCSEHHRPVEEILEAEDEPDCGPAPVPPDTWSISQLNLEAQRILEEAFDESVWVVGELQGFDRNRSRDWRHAFFELVERPTEDADPVAKIQAVLFQGDRERVEDQLDDAPEEIRLRDGLAVRVCGDVEIYPESGSYQIVVREIDPTYTSGEIQRNRQAILERLEEKGIREANLERSMPICPLRVGLITSRGSDAYEDFRSELEASGYGFQVAVHDAYMQGDRTEESVLAALERFEERSAEFDVVVVVRGGGARSDLAYFDTDAIGEAVCRHPLKVISGIGHERDVCLLDHIARSEKTPTAAGRMLVERVEAFDERLRNHFEGVLESAEDCLDRAGDRLERVSVELGHRVDRRLNREDRRLSSVRSALSHAARDRLEEGRRRVEGAAGRLPQLVRAATERERQRLAFARRQLRPERLRRRLDRERSSLDASVRQLERAARNAVERGRSRVAGFADRLRLLDPQKILNRGYALVRRDGDLVRSPDDAPPESRIDVDLAEGAIRARVEADAEASGDRYRPNGSDRPRSDDE